MSGHCPKGGDAFAERLSFDYGIPLLLFPPKKKIREEFFARNTLIAEHSDILIACLISPHESIQEILKRTSGGSEDTITKFMDRIGYHKFYWENDVPATDEIMKRIIIV